MKKRFKTPEDRSLLRDKIIGLGERSIRKSYYPELQARLSELEAANYLLKKEIEERKRTEQALKESETRFRDLAELLPVVVFETDIEGNLVYVNRSAFDQFGYSQHDFEQGLNAFDMIALDDQPGAIENINRILNGEDIGLSEYSLVRKDSSTFQGIIRSTPIIHEGKADGLRGIIFDITERKRAEEERLKLQFELQQSRKMEAIGTLAGGIAHDFNNILQAINGFTELLLIDKDDQNQDYVNLNQIKKAGGRAAELIQQLLLFSRKAETESKPVDLNLEIEQARRLLERTIPKMINIEINTKGRLWTIKADPVQIEQILLNLGTNAADAMHDHGNLIIETENVTLDEEYAKSHLDAIPGNYVLLTVSDTGEGIDKESVEHIFEPFYTTKELGKGTGLGLASVYGIVKSHGGYIICYSEIGQGTTFKIYLPAIDKIDIIEDKDLETKTAQGGAETILLVDDEESIRDFASKILRKLGYTVVAASSGEEAMKNYSNKSNEIDLVILDIGMPGMGGHRCLKELLRLDPSAKVIIASGYSLYGQVKNILEAGAVGYIGKPYMVTDLLNKVRTVLDRDE